MSLNDEVIDLMNKETDCKLKLSEIMNVLYKAFPENCCTRCFNQSPEDGSTHIDHILYHLKYKTLASI